MVAVATLGLAPDQLISAWLRCSGSSVSGRGWVSGHRRAGRAVLRLLPHRLPDDSRHRRVKAAECFDFRWANAVRGKKLGWTHLRNAGDGYVGGRQYLAM